MSQSRTLRSPALPPHQPSNQLREMVLRCEDTKHPIKSNCRPLDRSDYSTRMKFMIEMEDIVDYNEMEKLNMTGVHLVLESPKSYWVESIVSKILVGLGMYLCMTFVSFLDSSRES